MPELQRLLASLDSAGFRSTPELFSLGAIRIDEALRGGLACGALHEFFAAEGTADAAALAGFGLGVALRAAAGRPVVWVRQAFVDTEAGGLHGAGLMELGLDPTRLTLVRVRDPTSVLRAAAEAARCSALGAVLVELWGEPRILDLRASRRLTLAARQSGLVILVLRLGARPAPSAATSRWSVSGQASAALEANAPGRPAFSLRLLRHRAGITGEWLLEWDRDRLAFADFAPLSRIVVPVSRRGQGPAGAGEHDDGAQWRRAG